MSSRVVEARGRLNPALRVGLYLPAIAIAAGGFETLIGFVWRSATGVLALPLQLSLPAGAGDGALLRRGAAVTGVVLVTYLFRRGLDRRSLASLGLQRRPGWVSESLVGFVLGAVLMTLVFGAELGLGAYRLRAFAWQQHSPDTIVAALGVSFAGFVVVAFYEELVVRGYILQNLAAVWGTPAGLIVSSGIFALAHLFNPGGAYMLARNLWLPMGLHLSWNLFQGPIFGFPVSGLRTTGLVSLEGVGPGLLTGSTFGPEASLVGVTVSLLGLAFLWRWAWVQGQGRRVQD